MWIALLRRIIVVLLCLVPLITLVHRNDVGRWEFNRCAMAAPDEFSYLLMAKSIALHGTISTTEFAGRDTFYPPGYPAILAVWGKLFGFSIESMHICTALLLCAAAGMGYLLAVRMLNDERRTMKEDLHPPWSSSFLVPRSSFFPLLILALFVLNWHVLEGALFIFSEPAFMLVTFTWLLLALAWRTWYLSWRQTLVLALLAAAAISIRGAGLVCFAAMLLYPLASLLRHWRLICARRELVPRLICVAIVVAVAIAYQAAILRLSPEKSLAVARQSSNSYTKQLLRGISDGGKLDIARRKDWEPLLENTGVLIARHIDDFSQSFVPWFRDDPPIRPPLFNLIGKFVLALSLAGWMWQCVGASEFKTPHAEPAPAPRTRFLEGYVGLYIALYLIWPFDMTRFWTPLLPIMLVYAVIAMRAFGTHARAYSGLCSPGLSPQSHRDTETSQSLTSKNTERLCASSISLWLCGRRSCSDHKALLSPCLSLALMGLLLVLSIEEIVIQLPHYQRRLNYVSDALAAGARRIVKLSPDPAHTTVCVLGGDEQFTFAWYLPAAGGGLPASPATNARRDDRGNLLDERFEDLLARKLTAALASPGQHVFAASYFTHADVRGAIENLRKQDPTLMAHFQVERVFQKGIEVAVWEFVPAQSTKAAN